MRAPNALLLIPFSRDGREKIRDALPGLRGVAGSPMPAALRAAREGELRQSRAGWQSYLSRQNAIIVSDGVVDREGACHEARLLRQDGVRVTIIGLEYANTPEGSETLRYVATHPDCAAGNYIRVERPDLLGLGSRRGLAVDVTAELSVETEPVMLALPLEIEVPPMPALGPLTPRAVADFAESVVVMSRRRHSRYSLQCVVRSARRRAL